LRDENNTLSRLTGRYAVLIVVRALVTPSIAALLGRWFWWPQRPVAVSRG
jgi:uncharacterized membrane protein YdfJ with MMPL/SSD domain